MSLSPNAPASRPAAPAPRPDLEALLLEAVRQRDGQAAARRVQQWVHRRGVASLEHFQLEILAPSEGSVAFDWLCQVIDEGPVAVAVPVAASQPSPVAAAIPGPQAGDAATRAIAAVDAAFDALAAEFPQFRRPDPALQHVAFGATDAAPSAGVPLEPPVAPEQPVAVLAASSEAFRPELQSADIDLEEPPAVLEEPPADLFDDPVLFPSAVGHALVGRRFSFDIPQPAAEPASELPAWPASPNIAEAASVNTAEPTVALESAALEEATAQEATAQEAPLARLRHRLRRGLSLTRVRTLMRDCLDEAVASLHPPQHGPLDVVMEAGESDDFACQDERLPDPAGITPTSTLTPPLASSVASVEPSRLPAPGPSTAPEPPAPAPAFALVAMAGVQDIAVQDVAAPPSPAAQLRERLRARRVETRPAPAPASLSDLRAWLPSDDDLPRAS